MSKTIKRPHDVPEIGGCPADCGHSDDEHIAFDIGVRDGAIGADIPDTLKHSENLKDAWLAGVAVGKTNRP